MSRATVKMSLHLSPETNDMLEQLSRDNHLTKSDLLRKSLALMQVALKNKKNGNHLVVLNDKGEKEGEIIGL
jgi:predicted DNA-binding protein